MPPLDERDWNLLLRRIEEGRCTPFLGAGACFGVLPLGSQIATDWAEAHNYPLEDCGDLARVAQYLAVMGDDMSPKEEIAKKLTDMGSPNFADSDEPHGVLAQLPLPIYITTNYDSFMVEALKMRHRNPTQELCRWNQYLKKQEPQPSGSPRPTPTVATPLVFHLHGHCAVPESLVLTEDDYLNFLVSLSRDQTLLPPEILKALTGSSVLFIGYRISDWDFRVLFRSLVGYLENSVRRAHVSVQLMDQVSPAQQEKAQEYLRRYFEKLDIRVFWATAREFAAELRTRWESRTRGK